jgi:hypothetical protein
MLAVFSLALPEVSRSDRNGCLLSELRYLA